MDHREPLNWAYVAPGSQRAPLLTSALPGIGGYLSDSPEDFIVEEVLPYEPEGQGEHFFVKIRKRDLATTDVAGLLARWADVPAKEIGFAGRKDVRSVSTQWFSIPKEVQFAVDDRIEVLEIHRHTRKLRTGHVKLNRFKIRIRDVATDARIKAVELLKSLELGFPNYFGTQRFGSNGSNLNSARRWLERSCPKVKGPRFMVSVIQSAVFNAWLGERVTMGQFGTVIPGDVLKKRETGGLFISREIETDQQRSNRGEVDFCGPIFGPKMKLAADVSQLSEEAWIDALNLTDRARRTIGKFGAGSRRVARVQPEEFELDFSGGDAFFSFALPSGSYATTFLAELIHPEDGSLQRIPDRSSL